MDRSTAREMVTSLIGDEGIAAARAPIEQASGLPNAAYTDAAWLDLDGHHRVHRPGPPSRQGRRHGGLT
ncbi:MAG: hypothetical protein MK358_13605 [Vicinamibacterales bacterium]|nr:hypothetical protein [Vicinamibacterales bacterium]